MWLWLQTVSCRAATHSQFMAQCVLVFCDLLWSGQCSLPSVAVAANGELPGCDSRSADVVAASLSSATCCGLVNGPRQAWLRLPIESIPARSVYLVSPCKSFLVPQWNLLAPGPYLLWHPDLSLVHQFKTLLPC